MQEGICRKEYAGRHIQEERKEDILRKEVGTEGRNRKKERKEKEGRRRKEGKGRNLNEGKGRKEKGGK